MSPDYLLPMSPDHTTPFILVPSGLDAAGANSQSGERGGVSEATIPPWGTRIASVFGAQTNGLRECGAGGTVEQSELTLI